MFELYPLVMVSKTRSGLLILRLIKVILILSGSVKPSLQPLCTTSLSGSETLLNEKPCAPIASIRLQPSTTSRAKPDVEKLIAYVEKIGKIDIPIHYTQMVYDETKPIQIEVIVDNPIQSYVISPLKGMQGKLKVIDYCLLLTRLLTS